MKLTEQINTVLMDWNPIGVGADIAESEYEEYIPQLIQKAKDQKELTVYLEKILVNDMGLSYNRDDKTQRESVQTVSNKIVHICHSSDY